MADSVIGAIRAVLSMDTAAFASGAKEAESTLERLSSKFTSTAKTLAAGLGIGLTAKAFADSVNKMIDKADEMGKAAQKFGVPVETLSALSYAAELADVSFEALGKGLGKLSKAMLDGLINPSGDAMKNFKALGVAVTDGTGRLRSTEDVFGDIAEKFSNMQDGAVKTALAIRIFGKAGAELIPLLNEGRAGIKHLTDEAAELGIVISGKTAAKAQEFNDTLKRIHTISQAMFLQIAENMLPVLQKLADMFLEAKKNGSFLQDLFSNLITTGDIDQVTLYTQRFENLARIWSALKAFPGNVITKSLQFALGELDRAVDTNKQKLLELKDRMSGTFDPVGKAEDALVGLGTKGKKAFEDIDTAALKTKDSIDKFIESQKRQAEGQSAANQIISQAAGIQEAARFQSELDNKVIEEKTTLTRAQIAAANDAKNAIVFAAQTAELKRFVEEGKSDWDKYIEKLDELKKRMEQFPQFQKDLNKTLEKINSDMRTAIAGSIATALGGFSQLFMAAAGSNKRLFEIGKAFAIAEATVNTFKAANQALTAPPGPPFSYIYVAGAIAAGIANVIKITQTKFTAAALGGRFRVPGGSMGVDTGIFPMKLAPGELVEVTPASQVAGPTNDGILSIPAINPRDFFSGDTVRYMVESIDRWMRDGGTGIRMVPR